MATRATTQRSTQIDEDSKGIIFEGANKSQLEALFRIDNRVLNEYINGLAPVGKRGGVDIFDVSEVAKRIARPSDEQVERILPRMNHAALPKQLTKEFWQGQKTKQDFLLRAGELWSTDKVVAEVGEMVKQLNMELNLLIDGIERNTEMSEKQREVAAGLVEGAKANMVKRLKEKFQDKTVAKPVAPPPAAPVVDDDEL